MKTPILLFLLFLFAFKQADAQLPGLGFYPAVNQVTANGNIRVFPDDIPVNATGIRAITSTAFKGILLADLSSGEVIITNAYPSGIYEIFIKAFNGPDTVTRSFMLTVTGNNCSQGLFTMAGMGGTGNLPFASAIGDFNRDGNQDLVVANFGNNNVSVKLGNGNGGFSGNQVINTGPGPQSVAIADMNGDGFQDMAVANFSGSSVTVLIGNGYGGFSPYAVIPVGSYPYAVALSDFDGDEDIDMITADYGSNMVSIRLGDGYGGFYGNTELSVGAGPRSVAVADFNMDGKADFATANFDGNSITAYTGNGNGLFSLVANIPVGNKPYSISTGDFNEDGFPDLVTANNTSHTASILLATVSGGFTAGATLPVGFNPRTVITADVNGDGHTDIATTNISSNSISVKLGDGSGAFTSGTDIITGASPFSLVSGDLNNDGLADMAVTNAGNNSVFVNLGGLNNMEVWGNNLMIADNDSMPAESDHTNFGEVSSYKVRQFQVRNTGLVKLTVTDISISGTDSSMFSAAGAQLPLMLEPGNTAVLSIGFTPLSAGLKEATVNITGNDCDAGIYSFAVSGNAVDTSPPVLPTYPSQVMAASGGNITVIPLSAPANITGLSAVAPDAFSGEVLADPVTGNVRIINAYPAGTYSIKVTGLAVSPVTTVFTLIVQEPVCSQGLFNYGTANSASPGLQAITLHDFNGDGYQDVAAADSNSNSVYLFTGNSNGNFIQQFAASTGNKPCSVASADFNTDGMPDLVTANRASNNITVVFGTGPGTFGNSITLTAGIHPRSVVTGDFNNDGKTDIATANQGSNTITTWLGNGFGGFYAGQALTIGIQPVAILAGDYNNDGYTDFVAANSGSNSLSVLLGNSPGTFSLLPYVPTGNSPVSIAHADINKDGKLDILVSNYGSHTVSVRFGDGNGGFSGTAEIPVGNNPVNITAGDYNGDGYTDFATANQAGQSVSVRLARTNGTFAILPDMITAGQPSNLLTGDFNNDGMHDLAVTKSGPGNLLLFAGNVNEMDVQGNNVSIVSGDSTPSLTDHTDFGNVSTNLIRNFVISNNGFVNLSIKKISVTGTDSSLFTLGGISLPLKIPAGGSIPFTISFTPGTTGLKSAAVLIENDDCDEGGYHFALSGNGFSETDPTLGIYPATTISHAGSNMTVTPSAAPTNAPSITAYASPGFKGLLTVDPQTGVVSITNAHPAGVYTVTVKVSGVVVALSSFTLTVNDPVCNGAVFSAGPDVPVGNLPFSVAIGDFNRDGKQDMVTANYAGNDVSVRLGNGDGTFHMAGSVPVGNNPNAVAVGDFNGDGNQDIAVSNFFSNSVSIRLGDGTGGFVNHTEVNVGVLPSYVAVGDFNADGKQDIAAVITGNTTVAIRLGDGSGNFSGSASAALGSGAFSIAIADFNADGIQDIASADYNMDTVSINLGDGLGGFYLASQIEVGINPYAIAAADFNKDGFTDIATANFNGDNVSIRMGDGTGNFGGSTEVPVGDGPGSIAVGDFNGDGNPDFTTAEYSGNSVSVILGNGSGSFSGTIQMALPGNPYLAVVGDFNADGRQDIAVSTNNNTVSVIIGNGVEINVQGNNTDIPDGADSATIINGTEFGTGNNTVRSFTIQNQGMENLQVYNMYMSGDHASLYSISGLSLPAIILPGQSATFLVSFSPVWSGTWPATVNVINNDCNESVYNFIVQGTYECPQLTTGITGLPATVCANAPAVTISGYPLQGGVFSGAGITSGINGTAIFDPAIAGAGGPYEIKYVYTDAANGCEYNSTQLVLVNPLPAVSISGLQPSYCISSGVVALMAMPAGGVFSGPGITGNIFDPALAGEGGPFAITYTYTDISGCSNTATETVTVYGTPVTGFTGLPVAVCMNEPAISLTGFPAGGVFTGPGISDNLFNPAVAGAGGPYPVTYSYTGPGGCMGSFTGFVIVHALPVVSIGGLQPAFCANSPSVSLTGFPSGGLFSGSGIFDNQFDPSLLPPGSFSPVTYSVTDFNGCSSSITEMVSILPLPVVTVTGLSPLYCSSDAAVTIVASQPGGVFSFSGNGLIDAGNGSAIFQPGMAGAGGPYHLTYTYTNVNGCTSVTQLQVTVIDCPAYASLSMKMFLEGYCRPGGQMVPTLYELGMSSDPTAADFITVNLWSPFLLSAAEPGYSVSGILHSNGMVDLQLPASVIGNFFYIAVKHRNSLETWSSSPVLFNAAIFYDFSSGLAQAYGDGVNQPMVETGGVGFAFYSGDVNQDGTIDASDMALVDNDNAVFAYGYNVTDLNGDAATDASDISIVDNNQDLFLFYARPF